MGRKTDIESWLMIHKNKKQRQNFIKLFKMAYQRPIVSWNYQKSVYFSKLFNPSQTDAPSNGKSLDAAFQVLSNTNFVPNDFSNFVINALWSLCPLFSQKLRYIKFKNLDQITIKNNVYLYQHYQKTKTLCRHVSRFPRFTASD